MQQKNERREEKARSEKREDNGRVAPAFYWHLQTATEYLIYTILIFTPWSFGTTEEWSINTTNWLSYVLFGFMAVKWMTIRVTGFKPARWADSKLHGWRINSTLITTCLVIITCVLLGYCWIAAWNARAEFLPEDQRFEYFGAYRQWLPYSYDRSASWRAFWQYTAAAIFFWAVRDWLLSKSRREARLDDELVRSTIVGPEDFGTRKRSARMPTNLKRLLWVLCTNGALLAFEGTVQRLSGTRDLLWLVRPIFNDTAAAQFGPFNYRSNGAQYLNMIWPLAIAFWWSLYRHSRAKVGQGKEFLLLPFCGLMVAAPIIASSRGGVVVAIAQVFAVIGIFAYAYRESAWKAAIAAAVLITIIGLGGWIERDTLLARINENTLNTMSGRTEIYQNARRIAADFKTWGTGPGTFAAIYQLYREDPDQLWYAHAHNDYLQTLVTFGRVGSAVISLAVFLVCGYWFGNRGIPSSSLFVAFIWVGLGGVLLHAKFDFPMQIYSVLLIVLTLCAILTSVVRR